MKAQYWRNEIERLRGEIAEASFRGDDELADGLLDQLRGAILNRNRYEEAYDDQCGHTQTVLTEERKWVKK